MDFCPAGTGLAFKSLPKRSVAGLGNRLRMQTGFRRQKNYNNNNKIQIQIKKTNGLHPVTEISVTSFIKKRH
jgi:hypothetical protein